MLGYKRCRVWIGRKGQKGYSKYKGLWKPAKSRVIKDYHVQPITFVLIKRQGCEEKFLRTYA
jgi:hypothetical protein